MAEELSLNLDRKNGGFVEDLLGALPEGFVADALALTSPRDACRLSLVDSVFRSAAESDAVWEGFLPPEYQKIMEEAVVRGGGSKKDLFLRLCDNPLLIDGGNKSFSLDKWSGKKCYMLAAKHLSIGWGDTPRYWRWISLPESRFAEVAELIDVCWFEICGKISTSVLSTNTLYAAYLVFKTRPKAYGFEYHPAEVSVGLSGLECQTRAMYLDPEAGQRRRCQPRRGIGLFTRGAFASEEVVPPSEENCPKQRKDGWLEVELGEYFNEEGGEGGELEIRVEEVKGGNWKAGIVVEGIDIRPKICK